MKKKQVGGLIIAVVLFIITGVVSVFSHKAATSWFTKEATEVLIGNLSFDPPSSRYIAIVRVEGTIQAEADVNVWTSSGGYLHDTTLSYIDQLILDTNNVGMLLYVDSPGGTVYESEELYQKLIEYKEKTGRPIWDYMAHYAASGGYMASVAADRIFANKNTVTGSIGVIMQGYDLSGLYEKLGIRYVSITSGEFKDSSTLSDDVVAIYQTQVDECYKDFVKKVADGRGMTEAEVKKLADGRTYTALQALDNGLIDDIALYEDMQDEMLEELGAYSFYEPDQSTSYFASLLGAVQKVIPKSEAQVLLEEAATKESGVLMYYAGQ